MKLWRMGLFMLMFSFLHALFKKGKKKNEEHVNVDINQLGYIFFLTVAYMRNKVLAVFSNVRDGLTN